MALTPEERKKILAEREAMAKALVQGTANPPKLLTDKERARLKVVQASLADGQNPYEEIGNKGQIGGGATDKDQQATVKKDLPISKIQELEKKWANRENDRPVAELDLDLGAPAKRDPTKLYCSFCGVEVPRIQSTKGTGVLKKKIEMEIIRLPNGQRLLAENIQHYSKKLVACPDHANLIKKVDLQEWDSE